MFLNDVINMFNNHIIINEVKCMLAHDNLVKKFDLVSDTSVPSLVSLCLTKIVGAELQHVSKQVK